jgi:transcriptional regulator with XRE-family HTH domain
VKLARNRVLKNIGESVRCRRRGVGLSQEKLAEVTDMHRNYIGKIERGEQNPTIYNLVLLAKALRCKVSDILRDAGL